MVMDKRFDMVVWKDSIVYRLRSERCRVRMLGWLIPSGGRAEGRVDSPAVPVLVREYAHATKFQKLNSLGVVQHTWHNFNHASHLPEFAQYSTLTTVAKSFA